MKKRPLDHTDFLYDDRGNTAMIVDRSAELAILFDERDAKVYAQAIAGADVCRISAANFVEAAIVAENYAKDNGARQFDAFVRRAALMIEPVTEEQAHVARQAYSDFGKGRHRAGLNFGDCFAYALAKTTGEKLLFKGHDFRRTDRVGALSEGASGFALHEGDRI